MADAPDSKSGPRKRVWVQVPPSVLYAYVFWRSDSARVGVCDGCSGSSARRVFVLCQRAEAITFLRGWKAPIKFCHIDAAHDYDSVRETIELLLPRLVPGAVLFGHDFQSAHAGRDDLNGGVERAVRATLPGWVTRGNNWYYVHMQIPIRNGNDGQAREDFREK